MITVTADRPRRPSGVEAAPGAEGFALYPRLDVAQIFPATLTEQEWQVLTSAAHGYSNRGIADTLHVSRKTVEAHLSNVFLKLDIPPRPDRNQRVCAVLYRTTAWAAEVVAGPPAPTPPPVGRSPVR